MTSECVDTSPNGCRCGTKHRNMRQCTRPHRCGGRRRAWLRCPWAVAGPGRASSRRAEPKARGADGSRAGRRPRAHRAARPTGAPSSPAHGRTEQPGPRAHRAAGPTGAPSSPAPRPAPQKGPTAPGTLVGPLVDARIQAERPASSVARWTPPRPASWAAWVRQEKPSARYTASGCADRDGSSEWDATATDRS